MAGSRRLTALSEHVVARVQHHLPEGPLAIALSGGADSAVCGWAAGQIGSTVRAIHVDHGWPASAILRSAATDIAGHLEIPLVVIEAQARSGSSPEGQARLARYEALEGELTTGEWLLTGHTMDDQAETVLGNLLRGAGAVGLTGIPRRRGNILRPLLDVSRSETRELATLLRLPWIEDPTNLDNSLRRNALRRDIIPYLEDRMNPSFRAALVRMATALDRDEQFLATAAEKLPLRDDGSVVRLPATLLSTAPGPVAARAARRALRHINNGYPGSSVDVAAVLSVAGGGPSVELAGSVKVEREGVWVVLGRTDPQPPLPPARWEVPGILRIGRWALEAWVERTPPAAFPISFFAQVFDADLLPGTLTVRSMESGDRVAIVGGSKRIADVLAEAQIPVNRRAGWPLVLSGSEVLWVPGVRRGNQGWVSGATSRYLWVRATVEGHL